MTTRPAVRVVACCGGMVFFGGAERMTFAALDALRRGGASVHCILNGWAYDRIAREADAISATWSTSAYREPLELRPGRPWQMLRQAADHLQVSAGLFKELWRSRATHVLVPAHDVAIRNWPALLYARITGRPVVMMMHNVPADSAFYRRLWRWVVNPVVSRFVCNSDFTRAELLKTGIPAVKTEVIYCTVPSRATPAVRTDRAQDLIFVGQVIPPKGLHVLLDAVAELRRRGYDIGLDVVGDVDGWISPVYGNYREELKSRASARDLAGHVRFLGWREDVPSLFGGVRLHCCPSDPALRESFGLVVLEAKVAGVPSVVFRSGALSEIVTHGANGWVCEEPTATSLADACALLLSDADLYRHLSDGARSSAERFAPEIFDRAWRRVARLPETAIRAVPKPESWRPQAPAGRSPLEP